MSSSTHTISRNRIGSHVLLLTLLTVLLVGYMIVRFDGMFASNDAGIHSTVAASIVQTGSLTQGATYTNGFGYPALVALASSLTGLSVSTLQVYVIPFTLFVPILAAYVTCREILGERQGVFAAVLFLLHPFFLFSAFRSTHEKFTYALILLALYFLYVSFQSESPSTKVRFVIGGYICIFGITFLNIYFASTFITATAVSLTGVFLVSLYHGEIRRLRRLTYTVGISFAFLLLFILFLYPPAQRFLSSLGSVSAQTFFLIFGSAPSSTAAAGTSPYLSVFVRWQSFEVYLALVSFYILIYPIAGLTWLGYARSVLSQESLNEDQLPELFVFILSAAFGLLLVGAVVADQTGQLGANMQLRVFPLLGFMAIILTVRSVFKFRDRDSTLIADDTKRDGYTRVRKALVPALIIVLVIGFSGTAALKATNDPVVSNTWTAVTEDERATMEWTEANMQNEYLWVGYEPRLRYSHRIHHPAEPLRNRYDPGTVDIAVQYLVFSDTIEKHAEVVGAPLPPRANTNRIYTNGDAQVYWYEQYQTLDAFDDALRRSQRA